MIREFPMSVIFACREDVRNVLGSQVPVDDWRLSLVEVNKSTGHTLQDRPLEGERKAG